MQELGIIPNMGNLMRYLPVLHRVKKAKSIEILALGGSITAGGYLNEFARSLENKEGFKVTMHNHGHGATEIQCKSVYHILEVYVYCTVYLTASIFI